MCWHYNVAKDPTSIEDMDVDLVALINDIRQNICCWWNINIALAWLHVVGLFIWIVLYCSIMWVIQFSS